MLLNTCVETNQILNCIIIHLFTVTFDQFNASLLYKKIAVFLSKIVMSDQLCIYNMFISSQYKVGLYAWKYSCILYFKNGVYMASKIFKTPGLKHIYMLTCRPLLPTDSWLQYVPLRISWAVWTHRRLGEQYTKSIVVLLSSIASPENQTMT